MRNLAKCVGVLALAVAIFIPSLAPEASAGILHHEKSPAARQRKAEHRAHKAEKKMTVKNHLFSHGG